MALEATDLTEIGKLIAAAMAPLAANMSPEALAKAVTPVIEAQLSAKGVVTKAELDKQAADAKTASDAAAKVESDRIAAEKAAADGKGKGKEEKAVDPALAELKAQLAAIQARSDAAEKALQVSQDANRTKSLHDSAREALIKAGIPAERAPFAMAYIKDMGVLAFDGDRAGWKGTDPKLNVPAVLDMEAAAKAWADGDGKIFLPPVGAAGTGDGAGNRGKGGTSGEVSLESLRASAGNTIMGALNQLG